MTTATAQRCQDALGGPDYEYDYDDDQDYDDYHDYDHVHDHVHDHDYDHDYVGLLRTSGTNEKNPDY